MTSPIPDATAAPPEMRVAMRAGFGLGRLHHLFSARERERVVRGAYDAGFRHFDVAPAYGDGLVERELGRILGDRRSQLSITTKFGIPFRAIGELATPAYYALRALGRATRRSFGARYDQRDFSPDALVKSLEDSLRRLRTDYVDFLLVHEPLTPDHFAALGPTWETLERLRDQGKIRSYGVSGDTGRTLAAERAGHIPRAAARMVRMDVVSCGLPPEWFTGHEVFIFNIVQFLRRRYPGPARIQKRVLVEEVARAAPYARPIFETQRSDEILLLGEEIARWNALAADTPAREATP